ncbi:hypothetical protein [Paracidovorax avenae]|uniref:hypothetical protein n=1 Tax=Paracidovorax avenae TaxID=80867 RepID=UPI0012602BF4|nr:hypothetical protein [Paracidovorax avenae]
MDKSIFPSNVVEVFDFIVHGELLVTAYAGDGSPALMLDDMGTALERYTNQDVEPPDHFLLDITADAAGEIPLKPEIKEFSESKRKLAEYDEQKDFYQIILRKVSLISEGLEITKTQSRLLADAISGDLYKCAEARLCLKSSHPYFERVFAIYKNQGFPCGWRGGDNWRDGDFYIYSRRQ